MKKAIFVLLATVILWFIFLRNDTVRFGPGVLAPDPPKQANNNWHNLQKGRMCAETQQAIKPRRRKNCPLKLEPFCQVNA